MHVRNRRPRATYRQSSDTGGAVTFFLVVALVIALMVLS